MLGLEDLRVHFEDGGWGGVENLLTNNENLESVGPDKDTRLPGSRLVTPHLLHL